jgi:hypothetical protein
MSLRRALIEAAKTPPKAGSIDEIRFLRDHFGKDFLDDTDILSVVEKAGVLQWFKIIPKFFAKNDRALQSSDQMVIGEVCSPRNVESLKTIFGRAIADKEFTSESPLKIAWLRPSVDSWGRSIAFLDGIKSLREIARGLLKGAVKIELWENRHVSNKKLEERLKVYWPWFDDVRFFRSPAIPSNMEMILVGDCDGIAVTHAFTPPQACFPCPIGVAFKSSEMIRKLVTKKIVPELRSLPKPMTQIKNVKKKLPS